jgi:hypothetical protein
LIITSGNRLRRKVKDFDSLDARSQKRLRATGELRKANTDLAYYLTFTSAGWIDVFTRKELADILIKKLRKAQYSVSTILSFTLR